MPKKISKTQMNEFEKLVRLNMKKAYFAALGIVGGHDAAMDISQEAFIRAYKHFGEFDQSRSFFPWYYKILRNLCLNFIRDKKRKKETSYEDYIAIEFESSSPAMEIENEERRKQIEKTLNALSFEDREVLILKEFQGYSYKEISDFLEIPQGTVMSRLFYARKRFASKFRGIEK